MSTATIDLTASVISRLAGLRFAGEITAEEAAAVGASIVESVHGAERTPEHIRLQLAIDLTGVVRLARYRTHAGGAQLAAYDAMSELCLGRKLIDVAAEVTPRTVEALLRGANPEPAFTLGSDADQPYYVLRKAAERLNPVAPAPAKPGPSQAADLPWTAVGLFEKVRRIEAVLDQQVRPALASDGGGLDLVDLKGDELWVQYHGACGSCSSSIGGTLQFIQDSLNNHLGVTLAVKVSSTEVEQHSLV